MYHRVIPRDLFNEAKLLKCLGQLALFIHDGVDNKGQKVPSSLTIQHDGEPFHTHQNPNSGDLYCETIAVLVNDNPISVCSAYNNKRPYPLLVEDDEDGGFVFEDDGSLSEWFLDFITEKANR